MLNSGTKYRIANQWVNGVIDKNSFEFANKGKFAAGKLAWITTVKNGDKKEFVNHKIDFVCFGDNIALIEDNISATFNIDGRLEQYNYTNKEGKKIYNYKIIINKVNVVELGDVTKLNKKQSAVKEEIYDVADEFDLDDSIPF